MAYITDTTITEQPNSSCISHADHSPGCTEFPRIFSPLLYCGYMWNIIISKLLSLCRHPSEIISKSFYFTCNQGISNTTHYILHTSILLYFIDILSNKCLSYIHQQFLVVIANMLPGLTEDFTGPIFQVHLWLKVWSTPLIFPHLRLFVSYSQLFLHSPTYSRPTLNSLTIPAFLDKWLKINQTNYFKKERNL